MLYVMLTYARIKKMPEGTPMMIKLADIIRNGSKTFLRIQFRTVAIVVAFLAIVFSLFIETWSGLTFLLGATMSSAVCILGMHSATHANVRTTNRALNTFSIGETVKVALMGGSISGLAVQACGTFGLVLILCIRGGIDPTATGYGLIKLSSCNPTVMMTTTYALGCSIVAMFNRVSGGNFTKAADISSDILAKVRHDMPEDDHRVPNVMADFCGDNVNDIAGNCSDLLESYVATIAATVAIAVSIFNKSEAATRSLFDATVMYPVILAGCGLLSCLLGIMFVTFRKMSDNPSKELDLATYISAGLTMLGGLVVSYFIFGEEELYSSFKFGWVSPFVSAVLGIAVGVAIGKITEYYTSGDYKPTQRVSKSAPEGPAFLVTLGDALGSQSVLLPCLCIALATFASYRICGIYGISIAALGMLSFVGTTVSIDAFGPISDNAGGLAEACELDPRCREITDKLDAVGNTTAAIGKGFAIGSAALATVSWITSFVSGYSAGEPILNIASAVVMSGAIIGVALVEYFSAMLTKNTIDSAVLMADEGERQLDGILAGTAEPDYNRCIELATKQALRKMTVPSVIAIFVPIIGGFIFGLEFVGGVLIGSTLAAIPKAIFMGNSGGAFDNAKKYIEGGNLEGYGKGSAAHKAAVIGDTIGDTRKDVVGVALDIFIKMMSTVANTLVSVLRNVSLF
ncbi:sodium-translocating pyrophosphatase [Candidatus Saccharibacteria bacterium]|nr:sodium-translocating pyrophosphatase [Candidatus Saccharibacteria bacterium]